MDRLEWRLLLWKIKKTRETTAQRELTWRKKKDSVNYQIFNVNFHYGRRAPSQQRREMVGIIERKISPLLYVKIVNFVLQLSVVSSLVKSLRPIYKNKLKFLCHSLKWGPFRIIRILSLYIWRERDSTTTWLRYFVIFSFQKRKKGILRSSRAEVMPSIHNIYILKLRVVKIKSRVTNLLEKCQWSPEIQCH